MVTFTSAIVGAGNTMADARSIVPNNSFFITVLPPLCIVIYGVFQQCLVNIACQFQFNKEQKDGQKMEIEKNLSCLKESVYEFSQILLSSPSLPLKNHVARGLSSSFPFQ